MTLESQFIPDPESQGSAELAAMMEALFSENNATQKTVLDGRQVIALARAKAFARLYNIPPLDTLCDFLMQLKISQGGRGRTDVVKAIQAAMRRDTDDEFSRSRVDKLLGRK